ncbi:MAG: hypothetical protein KDA05_09830 [Phycisphaerales bacterium]|nr:hypothetical protein [Phycisphaerales bacterium]
MTRTTIAGLAVAMVAAPALGDWPTLPTEYYSQNTIFVAQVDLRQISPTHVRRAVSALIDVPALRHHGVDITQEQADQAAAQAAASGSYTQPLVDAGITTLAIVGVANEVTEETGDPTMGADMRAYMLLAASSERAAAEFAESIDRGEQPMFAGVSGVAHVAQFVDDEHTEHWVVLPFEGVALPTEWSPQRQAHIEGALSDIGDYAARFVFSSNFVLRDAMRPLLAEESLEMRQAAGVILDADWVGGYMDLGHEPQFGVVGQLGDNADADIAWAGWSKLMSTMRSEAEAWDADAAESRDEDEPVPAVQLSDVARELERLLRMERTETRVRVRLLPDELVELSTMLLRGAYANSEAVGRAVQDVLPRLMR